MNLFLDDQSMIFFYLQRVKFFLEVWSILEVYDQINHREDLYQGGKRAGKFKYKCSYIDYDLSQKSKENPVLLSFNTHIWL